MNEGRIKEIEGNIGQLRAQLEKLEYELEQLRYAERTKVMRRQGGASGHERKPSKGKVC